MSAKFTANIEEDREDKGWLIRLTDTVDDRVAICKSLEEFKTRIEELGDDYGGDVEVTWSKDQDVTDMHFKEIHNKLESTKLTMGMLNSAEFEFKTLEDARSIASLLSNACPQPESIVMGLTELMINAIEHGNLGITYNEKSILNEKGSWVEEVNRRLQLDININKAARINFQRHSDRIDLTIIDQGDGFDNQDYMDFDPNRVMDNHGRGIAIANKLSFSSVEYRGKGNEVFAQLLFTK